MEILKPQRSAYSKCRVQYLLRQVARELEHCEIPHEIGALSGGFCVD